MIRHATVLGAGVMGSQIAAHLANAGVPVLLLDVTPQAAREGLDKARALRPDPFFTPDTHTLITVGGFDDGLAKTSASDWIVEAIVERLDIKRQLFERLEPHRRPDAIVSTNTSGIPIAAIAEGRSDGFRKRFLGTHFFNPPRYLRLLEIIPTTDTDPAVVGTIAAFADRRLGKGVVIAKDTPNFIANHIGLFGVARVFEALQAGFTIEEIDAITGPALGRPKSATFRTMDLAGVDVLGHVARNLASASHPQALPDPGAFQLPPFVEDMIKRGWVGDKAGQGFYKKVRNPESRIQNPEGKSGGDREILTLDPATMEYRPKQPARLASLDRAKSIEDPAERIKTLFNDKDRVGDFLRRTLGPTLEYVARVAPHIAHSPEDIDNAMKWGFGWELGPFETMRVLGMEAGGQGPGAGKRLRPERAAGGEPAGGRPASEGAWGWGPTRTKKSRLQDAKVVRKNSGASLKDLGDGVLGVEFHSKMNAIGGETIEMLIAGTQEASKNFAALVVGNDAPNFSAGANLMLLLLEAQEGNWDEIDLMIRAFQKGTMALKLADVPVVAAPAGLTLGGGCEIVLHGDRVQAAAETYIGLVEVGVGLIPAGGGTKEMLARAMESMPGGAGIKAGPAAYGPGAEQLVQTVFETIGFAKVATSGPDAKRYGYIRDTDGITMNRDRLIDDAKAVALSLAASGYRPPQPRQAIPVGGEGTLATLNLGLHLAWRAGRISDHDKLIGGKLAWILAGGNLTRPGTLTEQQLLDLEREAFLSLCGERKTQERIAHTLKTGKPLRN
jgi:3-hydroxyacyl-CoA dehydrogenase